MPYTYTPQTMQGMQPEENEVTWKGFLSDLGNLVGKRWQTASELKHISNPACGDLRNRTQTLVCTNFQITNLPETISGISLILQAQRNGRVCDEQIQLTYQGQVIGKNNFVHVTDADGHLKIENKTTYGSPTDMWDTEITAEMLQDPSFGVMLKFQAHPYYPHSCGMLLDSVSLTVY